eukprot:COSAG02_NODE_1767_length_11002_cov_41.487205_2_plen_121_part_00
MSQLLEIINSGDVNLYTCATKVLIQQGFQYKLTAPFHKSGNRYIQYDISAVRATQKLYHTSLSFVARAGRATTTVSFADRVSHPVDSPRPFLHVLRASGSARNGHQQEQSNRPRMNWIQN